MKDYTTRIGLSQKRRQNRQILSSTSNRKPISVGKRRWRTATLGVRLLVVTCLLSLVVGGTMSQQHLQDYPTVSSIEDDRTWLDIFGDRSKKFLTQDVASRWNELCELAKPMPTTNHHRRRRRRDYQSMTKNVAIQLAKTLSLLGSRLSQWSVPVQAVATRIVDQSHALSQKAATKSHQVVQRLEDRLEELYGVMGQEICQDLRERCQNRNHKLLAEEEKIDKEPPLQLAWQERLLCHRSVILPECNSIHTNNDANDRNPSDTTNQYQEESNAETLLHESPSTSS